MECEFTVAIVTVSTRLSRQIGEDKSGPALADLMRQSGWQVAAQETVTDDRTAISNELRLLTDEHKVDLIITTGGTGVHPTDVTPEATQDVIQRDIPGMAEAMRAAGMQKTPHAMISRAVVGIRNQTLIVNVPGSVRGAVESITVLLPALPHAVEKIKGDPSDCGRA
ncbi:MAG: MogA/MoaB family molybdenum cofactor biosynthesis protein [Deltaproteobacteria bacterium]|nr:MogA/MoaB family molybdenum cofactor biosynthesis protein [Deltaproteobacteria bacterium]